MAETKGVPVVSATPNPEVTPMSFDLEGLSPTVKTELVHLANTLALLRKATGLDASQAVALVSCQAYLQERLQIVHTAETARLTAERKIAEEAATKKAKPAGAGRAETPATK